MSERRRLGALAPKYKFVLNPYEAVRLTRCPHCEGPTKIRKLPFFVHVDPKYPIALNMTHRYCPVCDLIIIHRDELERLLLRMFPDRDPEAFHDAYMVMGTFERKAFRASLKEPWTVPEMLAHLHDFEEVLTLHFTPGGWYKDEELDSGR